MSKHDGIEIRYCPDCRYPFWIEEFFGKKIFLDHQEAVYQFWNCPECYRPLVYEELLEV